MRWVTSVRRIISIVFKGEDPVLREMQEARRNQEQMVLKVFRTLHEELLKKEQVMIQAREEATNRIKSVTQQVLATHPELSQNQKSQELTMDELYTYMQALKQNKIPFDLNADVRAQLEELKRSSKVDDQSDGSPDQARSVDIQAHLEELSRADNPPNDHYQADTPQADQADAPQAAKEDHAKP
ncbi:hypothetical protein SELMODRAFT_431623 [Selaginella moellendorffii]|uniref:Uncharacterized protein n=1 Tax=Selaginella moellendorffii TaxID=88036 RepID=D8TD92_SELML|nr:uncharacterized protein LOC9663407 [Selaginella moellendorffii]EFJ05394.1 hypothetical protein SELMODRAFT_431623 [Selaginella moellendorffii]|eukprot:XP_002993565.1 uncharacterized protein LOC9663407 [Selaginella moellendorffii]